MTPENIAILIIKTKLTLVMTASKLYGPLIKIRPVCILLAFFSLFFLVKKLLFLGMLYLVASFLIYFLPNLIKKIFESFQKEVERNSAREQEYIKYRQEFQASKNVEEMHKVLEKIKIIKKNDKDLKYGKIIYYSLIFIWIVVCYVVLNYSFDLLLRSL